MLSQFEAMFASPLLVFDVADSTTLNRALLLEIADERGTDTGIERSNLGGWHSSRDFFALRHEACQRLQQTIAAAVREATHRVAPSFDFRAWRCELEGWINVLPPGACNTPHVHPTFQWSGVYYVATPEGSGPLEFLDPRTALGAAPLERAGCFGDTRALAPKAGQVVVFPSYVRHWVYPNRATGDRVSVAFNARWARRWP